MAVAIPAIFCTVALPAYAAHNASTTDETAAGAHSTAQLEKLKNVDAQNVAVDADAAVSSVGRDAFSATSEAEIKRAELHAAMLTYRGPSVRSFLANPPYPNFNLGQVVAVAEQYEGVPYAYGGATPAGFDCSGLTQFVYAQFGISLPHSVSRQSAGGTAIAASDALPGDLVVMSGHVGIYVGGNLMIDAPRPGETVGVHAIYTSNHWFVRYGI